MVVAVHGKEPARGATFRLLRAVLISAGLAALGWVLLALFGAGTAAAESAPAGSGGLLGGLVNGLTDTVDDVTGTVTGSASATVPSIVEPPPAATTPETVRGEASATVPAAKPVERVVPVARPAAPKPAAAAKPTAVKRTPRVLTSVKHQVAARKAAQQVVIKPVDAPRPDDQANRPGPQRAPVKVPPAPTAPSGSVSTSHDGPGTARGGGAVLPAAVIMAPPTEVCATAHAERDCAGRGAGLPATSPD